MSYEASIIIPIHVTRFRDDIPWKINEIIKNSSTKYEYIFSCAGSHEDVGVFEIEKCPKNIVFLYSEKNKDLVNVSVLRNIAIDVAVADCIIFSDVDIFLNSENIHEWINDYKKEKFSMIPCVYLSKRGERLLRRDGQNALLRKFYSLDRRYYMHLALFSFVVAISRFELNSRKIRFDEKFFGHGYEDFDFLISYFRQSISRCLYVGAKEDMSPITSSGFKTWLAEKGYERYRIDLICFHLPHKKSPNYKIERDKNRNIFYEKHSDFLSMGISGSDLFSKIFNDYVAQNIDYKKIRPILDLRTGHEGRFNLFSKMTSFFMRLCR